MKILVVDDDPLTLEGISTCLMDEGFQPFTASNGEEALKLWKLAKPHLVCLDIMMPKMDGYEVCRRIRAVDTTLPILFLSAKNEEIDVVVGLELGADDFIRKPFGKRELLARVRAVLRRAAARKQSPKPHFTLGHLTIFPEELRATTSDGETIDLSPREASILRVLDEHRGTPVSRDTFLERCWGINYFPDSRTLDQHIATLRRKIEPTPENPTLLLTVRGVGYRVG